MEHLEEKRICIKFCVKNGFNITKCHEMLQKAFGDNSLSRTRVSEWHRRFAAGRESVKDNPRPGRETTSTNEENIEKIKQLILSERRITLREIADECGISYGSCQSIVHDHLGMRRLAAKFVPKLLNFQQMAMRRSISLDMISQAEADETFLKRIITGDETWIYGYDAETTRGASEWRFKNEPRAKVPRAEKSAKKVMLIVFFDWNGLVHHEFVPTGVTVNKEYYRDVMRRLRENVRRKRPELWEDNSWILHHDNAPAHRSLLVTEFLAKHATVILPQPPYSPDLSPADYFLFARLKKPLKGRRFESIEDIKQNSQMALKAIKKNEYKKCFEEWKKRWHMCVGKDGDYFEGENINLN